MLATVAFFMRKGETRDLESFFGNMSAPMRTRQSS